MKQSSQIICSLLTVCLKELAVKHTYLNRLARDAPLSQQTKDSKLHTLWYPITHLRSKAADAYANLSFSPYVGTGMQNASWPSRVLWMLPTPNWEDAFDSANSTSVLMEAVTEHTKPSLTIRQHGWYLNLSIWFKKNVFFEQVKQSRYRPGVAQRVPGS